MKLINKKLAYAGMAAAVGLLPLLNSIPASAAESKATVEFKLNSTSYTNQSGEHTLKVAPYRIHNTSMVPLRALTESLGGAAVWNGAQGTVTLTGEAFGTLTLEMNSNTLVDDKGNKHVLPEKVTNKGGIIFVPVRGVAAAMNSAVAWNHAKQTITLTSASQEPDFRYTFDQDLQGWTGDFADLPVDFEESIYELEFARSIIPGTSGNASNYGLKLNGMNRSDDLFMFIHRKVDGLEPNTTYEAKLAFDMYSDVPGQMMGIGGSPGESVVVKAGVTTSEPKAAQVKEGEELYYRLNLDKGNQLTEGADLKIVGNVVKPDSDVEDFQRVPFTYTVKAKTNSSGELFLIIGTDSGYEGLTTLYFDNISLTLNK